MPIHQGAGYLVGKGARKLGCTFTDDPQQLRMLELKASWGSGLPTGDILGPIITTVSVVSENFRDARRKKERQGKRRSR